MARKRDRTFTGCWKCRSRKVKCDEAKPECSACRRRGIACSYGVRWIWVEDDKLSYKSDGRRVWRCDLTWDGFSTLPSDLVDYMIIRCDEQTAHGSTSTLTTSEWLPTSYNPFSAFQVQSTGTPRVAKSTQIVIEIVPGDDASPEIKQLSLSPPMAENPDLPWHEKMLFHHYVQQVASNMMPFQYSRNPWRAHYPALALSGSCGIQRALFHGMISHAAVHLAQLRVSQHESFSVIGSKSYHTAISELRPKLEGNPEEFAAVIASIFSLMFAEVYSGRSRNWRYHHRGAWTLVQQYRGEIPWDTTELAGVSLQCLNIIKIIGETAMGTFAEIDSDGTIDDPSQASDSKLASLISATPAFGYTLGASKPIIDCISQINKLQQDATQWHNKPFHQKDEVVEQILTQLNSCRRLHSSQAKTSSSSPQDPTENSPEVLHQAKAFLEATYIYLYRTIFDSPPGNVRAYVSETLHHVDAFFSKSNGNFSIWPAFIAAVEAYTAEDLEAAQRWLQRSTSYGMGNRQAIRAVVEEVWRRRAEASALLGVDRCAVAVDWRKVMKDMDCDVLLV